VLVLGANGNVGRYAVQLASRAAAHVIAAISSGESEEIQHLGQQHVSEALDDTTAA
jgi:NADPH:quinone reductase-like Zn-dependent oxidoreductase